MWTQQSLKLMLEEPSFALTDLRLLDIGAAY